MLQLVSNNPLVEVDGNYSTTIVIIAEDSDCKSDNEIRMNYFIKREIACIVSFYCKNKITSQNLCQQLVLVL